MEQLGGNKRRITKWAHPYLIANLRKIIQKRQVSKLIYHQAFEYEPQGEEPVTGTIGVLIHGYEILFLQAPQF